jgi:hypothetical protein
VRRNEFEVTTKVDREANIPPEALSELCRQIRQEFPTDDLMYGLHLLRVCMAIKEGALTLQDALQIEPEAAAPLNP